MAVFSRPEALTRLASVLAREFASVVVGEGERGDGEILAASLRLLTEASFGQAAQRIRDQLDQLPDAGEVLSLIEDEAGARPRERDARGSRRVRSAASSSDD